MATFRKGNYVADLGAMVVTGLGKKNQILFSPGGGTVDCGKESCSGRSLLTFCKFEIEVCFSFRWKPYGCNQQTGQHGAGQDQTEVSAL